MIRLNKPRYSFEQTLDECVAGITGNAVLRQKLVSNKTDILHVGGQYMDAVETGELYTIPPININDHDPVVINTLKKSDLIKIYEQYLVPGKKPARKIYDSLLNSAKEQCPFCGGIGTPSNLDHFLPKAHFPQFSVLPSNLVPSCLDCNLGEKAHTFATNVEDQIIQPYADKDEFFMEQWIFATYNASDDRKPGEFEYYNSPPENWTEVDKKRVCKHFNDFGLAKRYAIKAAEHLGTVLHQIKSMDQAGFDREVVKKVLLQPGLDAAPFFNHWQKGMYQALIHAFH